MSNSQNEQTKAALRQVLAGFPQDECREIVRELFQHFDRDHTATPARLEGSRVSDGRRWFTRAEIREVFDGDGDLVRPLLDALEAAESAGWQLTKDRDDAVAAKLGLDRVRTVVTAAKRVAHAYVSTTVASEETTAALDELVAELDESAAADSAAQLADPLGLALLEGEAAVEALEHGDGGDHSRRQAFATAERDAEKAARRADFERLADDMGEWPTGLLAGTPKGDVTCHQCGRTTRSVIGVLGGPVMADEVDDVVREILALATVAPDSDFAVGAVAGRVRAILKKRDEDVVFYRRENARLYVDIERCNQHNAALRARLAELTRPWADD